MGEARPLDFQPELLGHAPERNDGPGTVRAMPVDEKHSDHVQQARGVGGPMVALFRQRKFIHETRGRDGPMPDFVRRFRVDVERAAETAAKCHHRRDPIDLGKTQALHGLNHIAHLHLPMERR